MNASEFGISINHVFGMEQELSMIAFLLQQSVRLDPPANSVTMGTAYGHAEPAAKPTPSHLTDPDGSTLTSIVANNTILSLIHCFNAGVAHTVLASKCHCKEEKTC